jgi:1-acyl-sn-glycerol-3-phosphate acyltransferase
MPSFALISAAVRTIAAYIFVSLYILAVGPIGMLVAMAAGTLRHMYWLGLQGVRLGFLLTGIRFVAHGREHVLDRAAIYAMNHTSNLEPPVIYVVLRDTFPRFKILYKAVLRKAPIMGRIFDMAGFVPIDRTDRVQSDKAIAQAVRQLRAGDNLVVFPEGTRSRTGELLPFKKGAFIMAIQAQVPIVPIATVGAEAAMRKGSPFIWPTTIHVKLGAPIETTGLTIYDRTHLMNMVRQQIAVMLEELRVEQAGLRTGRSSDQPSVSVS